MMRFDRGLRSAMMKPYPTGHTAVPTDDFNKEDPRCQFGGVRDAGEWVGDTHLPTMIELQVRVTPLWVENTTASARLGDNNACSLYPPQSVISKVRVDGVGVGQYQKASGTEKIPFVGASFLNYRLGLPEPYLYEKAFLTQPRGCSIHWVPQGIPYLWAYGATQIEDDLHPVVFTLEAMRHETILCPTSLLSWKERGIFPTIEEGEKCDEVLFQDIYEKDQTRTFMESIEAGVAQIYLEVGRDEKGISLRIPYQSYRFSKGSLYYKRGE